MTTATTATTADRQAHRAAEHAAYKAEAAARREAERNRRAAEVEARRAKRTARIAARAVVRRAEIVAQKHRALIRKGRLAGRRDVTTAPCVTDDGLAFVSIEYGSDPGAVALFALQPATEGRGMIVVDHTAGAVVARGRDGAAALRAFARMLPQGRAGAARRGAATA